MGLWDAVTDVVGDVVDAAGDVVDDAKKFLDNFGLGSISKGIDPTDILGPTMQAAGLGYATSPPLLLGQVQIDAMKLTMGFGPPDTADDVETSASNLDEAGNMLVDADPKADRWDGSASEAYKGANSRHRHQTLELAEADNRLHKEIQAHAEDVAKARRLLQDKWDFLSDYDTATSWMSKIPGLAQAKLIADLAVAAEQTTEARITTGELTWNSFDRASRVKALLDKYRGAAEHQLPTDFGQCGDPFGNEHLPGKQLPSRSRDDTEWTVPDPGPLPTPPATPYSESAPSGMYGSAPSPGPLVGTNPVASSRASAATSPTASIPPAAPTRPVVDGRPPQAGGVPSAAAGTGARSGVAPVGQDRDNPQVERTTN